MLRVPLSLVAVLLFAHQVVACSCLAPPPPKKALETAAAVFAGTVKSVEPDGDFQKKVTLQVTKAWKGIAKEEVVVYTANDSAACGVNFEAGEYLIYTYKTDDGTLRTNLCTRTARLADAAGDVTELGEPTWVPSAP